jgi:hypothetical protein
MCDGGCISGPDITCWGRCRDHKGGNYPSRPPRTSAIQSPIGMAALRYRDVNLASRCKNTAFHCGSAEFSCLLRVEEIRKYRRQSSLVLGHLYRKFVLPDIRTGSLEVSCRILLDCAYILWLSLSILDGLSTARDWNASLILAIWNIQSWVAGEKVGRLDVKLMHLYRPRYY